MSLLLTDEQEMLRETAAGFVADNSPVSQLRHLRDTEDKVGFSKDVWKEFAQMGLTGILIPEDHGGSNLGHLEAGLVLAEIGRNLSPSPFLQTALGAVTALNDGSAEMQSTWLPKIAEGQITAALALDEGRKHRPAAIAMTAEKDGNGFRFNGQKCAVPFGHSADLLVVAARTSGQSGDMDGISLFAIERETDGIEVNTERLVDSSLGATITLKDVKVTADAQLGSETMTTAKVLNSMRAGAAAEIMGMAEGAATITWDYIRERKQFGQPVGAFQALQHRAAHLYAELQVANAATRKALKELDTNPTQAVGAVHVAKAMAGRVALLAVQEGVQMHGGVGMTDEYDIGLYMKRHRALEELYGDANFHTEEFARLNSY